MALADPLEELDAGHVRHVLVGDDELDGILAQEIQCLLGVCGEVDAIALALQDRENPLSHRFLVIDYEDVSLPGHFDRLLYCGVASCSNSDPASICAWLDHVPVLGGPVRFVDRGVERLGSSGCRSDSERPGSKRYSIGMLRDVRHSR